MVGRVGYLVERVKKSKFFSPRRRLWAEKLRYVAEITHIFFQIFGVISQTVSQHEFGDLVGSRARIQQ